MRSSVLRTLAYADIFDYPLTAAEIHHRLITKRTDLTKVKSTLSKFNVNHVGNLYFLPGRKQTVSTRLQRQRLSRPKMQLARRVGQWLKLFPTIKAVLVTGALAVGNATVDDDIDLLIICSSGHLWTTRLIVNGLLDILGLRRKPNSKRVNNKLCLNLWIDISSLKIKKAQRNLYTAYELLQAKPLWSRGDTLSQLRFLNSWVKNYLPNFPLDQPRPVALSITKPGLIEQVAYNLQLKYMQARKTREKVSPHFAFFHPKNMNDWVMQEYKQRLQKLGLKP